MRLKFQMKLTHKIMVMIAVVLVVSISTISILSITKATQYITDVAQDDLRHAAELTRSMCELAAESSMLKAKDDLALTSELFKYYANHEVTVEGGEMIADPMGERIVLNNQTEFVDMITDKTGSACTVFLNGNGTSTRIATSVMTSGGTRAVGTTVSDEVYNKVVNNGQSYYGRAWVVDRYFSTAYEPIYDNSNNAIGILFVGNEERSAKLNEEILALKIGKTGYIYTIDTKGVLQIHPTSAGKDISKYNFIKEITTKGPQLNSGEMGWINYEWDRNGVPSEKILAYTYFADWEWVIGVGSYLDEFTAPITGLQRAILIVSFICLFASLGFGYFLARSIIQPIVKLVGVAEAVSIGDINNEIDVKSKDEVGMLAQSFKDMIDYLKETATIAEKIANNDLTSQVNVRSENDVMGNAFQRMTDHLGKMIFQIRENSDQLASAATEIASASEEMAQGASSQNEQSAQVSTAIEEMTATILESSKNANEAREASENAANTANDGQSIVGETISGMVRIAKSASDSGTIVNELASATDKIGEIISVIDDIADQTNLLALNAAIEAARAGEQGRGFAVVADEVRKLAERTGKATGEITDMIKGIQTDSERAVSSMEEAGKLVENGKEMADRAGGSLAEINTVSSRVMDMIVQIATATDEQSAAAEQISKNMEHISTISRETATGAEESAAAAGQLSRQAEGMQEIIGRFKVSL
ncbi:MAG: Cache 3/Cache 2 fusion domain-containing protein [candidate division Zixibacteria bacterium]|nr:Cache 3/Cache 2 fusion domain-containing protein [candidate division Zixibacteria bacterium]